MSSIAPDRRAMKPRTAASATQRGFTLVEIMVVLVIVGIALSIAVANLFVSDEERVRHEAERLLVLIEKTRDQAAFAGYPIAMRLTEEGIAFLERDPNSVEPSWRDAGSPSLKARAWRDGVRASLTVANAANNVASNTNNTDNRAQTRSAAEEELVTFLPTGISAPFTLRVYSAEHQRVITGDALGNVAFRAAAP